MILKKLEIELQRYGELKGKHVGQATFCVDSGCVTINLTPELCDKMFLICAEGIISTAKEAAQNLTCAVLDHRALLGESA